MKTQEGGISIGEKDMSTSKLVKKASKGDANAFASLVTPMQDKMYRLAWSYLGNEADASDAVQNALISAWNGIGKLRDAAAFESWMMTILVNACKAIAKKHHPEANIDAIPESAILQNEVQDDNGKLYSLISRAPIGVRSVLVLYYGDGYTIPEISNMVGITEANVRQRLSRGRKAIQRFKQLWLLVPRDVSHW